MLGANVGTFHGNIYHGLQVLTAHRNEEHGVHVMHLWQPEPWAKVRARVRMGGAPKQSRGHGAGPKPIHSSLSLTPKFPCKHGQH